jgi:hypothetical protein
MFFATLKRSHELYSKTTSKNYNSIKEVIYPDIQPREDAESIFEKQLMALQQEQTATDDTVIEEKPALIYTKENRQVILKLALEMTI